MEKECLITLNKNIYHLLEASEPEDEKAHSIPAAKKVFFQILDFC